SIQITLGQIMRMIVCRQVDTKSAGLLLYGLQIASANLRRTRFEPYHKDVTVDLFRVPERVIGDEAWSPSDFKDAHVGNVGRAPSPANESCVGRAPTPVQSALARQRCSRSADALVRERISVIRCGADALVRERILCSADAS